MEQNIMNNEEVVAVATEEIVNAKSGSGLGWKLLIAGGVATLVGVAIHKFAKVIKNKRAKTKEETVEAIADEAFPKPIFDENGEPINYEEN